MCLCDLGCMLSWGVKVLMDIEYFQKLKSTISMRSYFIGSVTISWELSTYFFSSAWLCQQSSWNRNSSVVRLSVCGIDYLWSYCMDFFQILVVASPGPYAQTFFSFLKKKKFWIFYKYFSFSLTWDPMGAKISKRYSSYKSQPKVFKLFLNFLPNGPHKRMFGIFEILKIEILTNFIRFR